MGPLGLITAQRILHHGWTGSSANRGPGPVPIGELSPKRLKAFMGKEIYGLVGHPVRHSLSPAMHNAAFRHLGMDAEYRLFDVEAEGLKDFLSKLIDEGIKGANVTVPHKIAAKEFIEQNGELDEVAVKLGAVNAIKVDGEVLSGYNTDGAGFYVSLTLDLKFDPERKKIFILGAGGAARAIAVYLGHVPSNIYIFDIDAARMKSLKEHYETHFKKDRLISIQKDSFEKTLSECDLFVNATPIGMKEGDRSPIDIKLLRDGAYVYDLVYNVPQTALVKEAALNKHHAVTGLGMLLHQGARAFEIWTGQKAPVEVMRDALKSAINEMTK